MSQDHLELLFGAIRSNGGSSNNPTVTQFQVIYKRLLMRNEVNKFILYIYIYIYIYNDIYIKQVKCSNGNVGIMDGTSILCTKNYSIARNDTLEPLQICTNSTLTDHDYGDLPIYNSLSIYKSDIVKYKAGFITRSIRIKINCDQCSDALVSHTITSQLSNRKNGGGLINPSEDVVNICLYV